MGTVCRWEAGVGYMLNSFFIYFLSPNTHTHTHQHPPPLAMQTVELGVWYGKLALEPEISGHSFCGISENMPNSKQRMLFSNQSSVSVRLLLYHDILSWHLCFSGPYQVNYRTCLGLRNIYIKQKTHSTNGWADLVASHMWEAVFPWECLQNMLRMIFFNLQSRCHYWGEMSK